MQPTGSEASATAAVDGLVNATIPAHLTELTWEDIKGCREEALASVHVPLRLIEALADLRSHMEVGGGHRGWVLVTHCVNAQCALG
jgi:hypothetical protein